MIFSKKLFINDSFKLNERFFLTKFLKNYRFQLKEQFYGKKDFTEQWFNKKTNKKD